MSDICASVQERNFWMRMEVSMYAVCVERSRLDGARISTVPGAAYVDCKDRKGRRATAASGGGSKTARVSALERSPQEKVGVTLGVGSY